MPCGGLQSLQGGHQKENPDIWLTAGNPWEIARPETTYRIGFYGKVDNFKWTPAEEVGPSPPSSCSPAVQSVTALIGCLVCATPWAGAAVVGGLHPNLHAELHWWSALPPGWSSCRLHSQASWHGGVMSLTPAALSQVIAKAYDNPIPGYGTATVGNLRLWEALPVTELNLELFNEGKFSEVRTCRLKQFCCCLNPDFGTGPCLAGLPVKACQTGSRC